MALGLLNPIKIQQNGIAAVAIKMQNVAFIDKKNYLLISFKFLL
jgi:hypothetical protein